MESKKPWYSKTVWFNLVAACLAFYPPAQEFLVGHPEYVALFWSGVNMVLRLVSKKEIKLLD